VNNVIINTTTIEDAVRAAEHRFAEVNPLSRARHERARRVLPAGHSRQTLYYEPFPVTIVRGRGARVTDLDGHEYVNMIGDYVAGLYGHSCEPIQLAVRDAVASGLSLSGVNNREVELAELISDRIPSIQLLRFCNSGSEACLFSVLTAQHVTNRRKILVFNGCYHGGFMVYGPEDTPLSIRFELVKCTYNEIDATRAALRQHANEIAAVIVEPMLDSAGCIPGTREFLGMLREETQRHGSLLIFDEVGTSRLAPGGLQESLGITPDMTTLGKFWGGGFNFGAFGGSREIMRHFDVSTGGRLELGGTFNNNIVAMTAGLAGMRDVYTAEACAKLNTLGDILRNGINDLGRATGVGLQATGIGAVISTHWHTRHITHAGDVEPSSSPARRLFQLEMMLRGFYVSQRGMIALSLPMLEHDVKSFLAAMTAYVRDFRRILQTQS
jgi:glutamate-1-semialdehyde 2,1-aminomutase